MHKSDDLDSMICGVCAELIKPIDIQKAMDHFISCHPQVYFFQWFPYTNRQLINFHELFH